MPHRITSKLCAVEHKDYCEPLVDTFGMHEQPVDSAAGRKRKHHEASAAHRSNHSQGHVSDYGAAGPKVAAPAYKKQVIRPIAAHPTQPAQA